jgi:hypothetical protein
MKIARDMVNFLGIRNVNSVELDYIVSIIASAEMRGREDATKTMLQFIAKSRSGGGK